MFTLISKEKRRKVALWLGRVPTSIENICIEVLGITTALRNIVESEGVELAVTFTPTNVDNVLLTATKMALQRFEEELRKAITRKEQRRVIGKMAAHMVSIKDGKQLPEDVYSQCFEKVYEGKKSVIA